jgi:tetratricopeptide (TPR) repeat protein
MRMPGRKTRILLAAVLTVVGYACYEGGVYLWGRHHYQAAEAALDRRDVPSATYHIQKVLKVWPREPAVHLLAARAARRRREYDRALAHLQQLQKYDGPQNAVELEYKLLRVQEGDLDDLSILLAYAAEYPDAADTPVILEACIEGGLKGLVPAYAEGMTFQGGTAASKVSQLHRAVDQWLASRPDVADQAQGYVWRGGVHGLENDKPHALEDTRRALELDPNHFGARLQLGIFLAQEKPADALAEFETLHRREPANNQVRAWLAATHRNLGHLDEARVQLDELLRVEPNNVGALHERALVAMDAQRPSEAEQWLQQALLLAPRDPRINLAMGNCLVAAGRAADAKPYQEKFLELQAEQRRQHDQPKDAVRKEEPKRAKGMP